MNKTVITFGTFDLCHIGHINILKRTKELGNKLIVGVSSDIFTFKKKNRYPVFNQKDRMTIIKSIRYVDDVFLEESLEKKREYIIKYKADILVMGDDWKDKFNDLSDICEIVYLPRTKNISTTEIILKSKNII